jgi:phosphoglycerate kinase
MPELAELYNKQTIEDVELSGKRVLIRVDFNVPLDDKLAVTDDTRIRAALPTINYVLSHGGKPILVSHLGRPKGKVVDEKRLLPVAKRLEALIGRKVIMAPNCVGNEVKALVDTMKPGELVMLENVRFHPEEEKNDHEFAKQLAELADIYVNDAFGTAHRAHASTEGVTKYLPSCAGYLMTQELQYIGKALTKPEKPFIAVLGGAKVSDKLGVINNLMTKLDRLIIGGGMAYTFLKAQGVPVGESKVELDKLELAKSILERAKAENIDIMLPEDHVIATSIDPDADTNTTTTNHIPENWIGVDIGPNSCAKYKAVLQDAKTVFWNGPMGIFELTPFAKGTEFVARTLAALDTALTIVGGGDTVAAVTKLGLQDKFTHVSTGGGAALELLEGKILPGVAALNPKRT